MRVSLSFIFTLCLSFLFTHHANAADGPVKVKVGLTMGSFEMVAPSLIGSGEKKGAVFTAKEVKVKVDTLKTGMSLRDRHTHEKLESAKFPFITVTDIKATGGTGTAKITVKDVTKEVKFAYKEAGPGKATAEFKLNLKDFKISGINYHGVGVEDEIQISATVPYTGK